MRRFTLIRDADNGVIVVDQMTGARERVELGQAILPDRAVVEFDVPAALPSQKVCVIAT